MTFNIALSLILSVAVTFSMNITDNMMAYGTVSVGNVTDGIPRITLVEEEDQSFSLYETTNGTGYR